MIVHFDCPSPIATKDRSHYQSVIDCIQKAGHQVAINWDEATYLEMAESIADEDDWRLLCNKTLAALKGASAVILEASDKGVFGIGYQAAIALSSNKPTLLILREGGPSGSFVNGLEHPSLSRQQFNDFNLKRVITDFLESATRGNIK